MIVIAGSVQNYVNAIINYFIMFIHYLTFKYNVHVGPIFAMLNLDLGPIIP